MFWFWKKKESKAAAIEKQLQQLANSQQKLQEQVTTVLATQFLKTSPEIDDKQLKLDEATDNQEIAQLSDNALNCAFKFTGPKFTKVEAPKGLEAGEVIVYDANGNQAPISALIPAQPKEKKPTVFYYSDKPMPCKSGQVTFKLTITSEILMTFEEKMSQCPVEGVIKRYDHQHYFVNFSKSSETKIPRKALDWAVAVSRNFVSTAPAAQKRQYSIGEIKPGSIKPNQPNGRSKELSVWWFNPYPKGEKPVEFNLYRKGLPPLLKAKVYPRKEVIVSEIKV